MTEVIQEAKEGAEFSVQACSDRTCTCISDHCIPACVLWRSDNQCAVQRGDSTWILEETVGNNDDGTTHQIFTWRPA